MGLQDLFYPRMLDRAAKTQQHLTEADLRGAATTVEEGNRRTQLDQNLKYVLINITTRAAATVCRQHGLELAWLRSLPTIVRQVFNTCWNKKHRLSHGITETNVFKESFSIWEFELNRYETRLLDPVKIAILMNEATGQLQQPLCLNARATPTYGDTATAFGRLLQQQQQQQQQQ